MKHILFAAAIVYLATISLSSCAPAHGLPRNQFTKPAPHKRFVKNTAPANSSNFSIAKK